MDRHMEYLQVTWNNAAGFYTYQHKNQKSKFNENYKKICQSSNVERYEWLQVVNKTNIYKQYMPRYINPLYAILMKYTL